MSCKILVVEDEVIIAENLKLIIEELGHNVIGRTDSGIEALQALTSQRQRAYILFFCT